MTRLPLAQVTLCAVETRMPVLALQSLLRSMDCVDFGRVILFTDGWTPRCVVPGVELIDIDAIDSEAQYSQFMLRRLAYYVRSSHALVTRWDGFVNDASAWTPEFLVHDYVASVWPDQPEGQSVGSGGFSLRSRRFLRAGLDPRITEEHPDDAVMCRGRREFLERVHGVSFAPTPLARRFAAGGELAAGPSFGFHGVQHLPRLLDEPTLTRWLQELPEDFFAGPDAPRLAQAMLKKGMTAAAQQVLQRRSALGQRDGGARVLGLAARALAAMGLGRA
jgi:hypothetical protein